MGQKHAKDSELVQSRIETLVNKSKEAQDLNEDLADIEKKRERASNKNDAFRDLKNKISETREQHQKLDTWSDYASRMDLEIPKDNISNLESDVERELRSLTSKGWDDFDDATAVRDVITKFENHRERFRELTSTVRETVQDDVTEELDSVDRTLTLLQIPDIGDNEAYETCRNYQYFLNKLADGKPRDDITPEKWESHHDKFHELSIDLGDDLTGDAKDVIWSLLEDETVTLAEIDEAVLDDLKTFKEFSRRLSIQFTTNP
ncbi:hypothetical protein C463_12377 [Halorubrum californiense DSM 19288]|uniref:Uncharacterized protein n=1 Tax=Halorubrum californiense DSM 19288 TaxID=1227465 RepID=M0E3G2_9EURY|nr:hypothetical protein [Halorubrum californiense]ELZ41477.1 hypothetical protein C463_12377 [Halorubrum californiense DSM 19288]